MPRYSERYLEGLLEGSDYGSLVELQGLLLLLPDYDVSRPTRGLPPHFFVVVEGLQWFAQAGRSGVWTYFEATPPPRQHAMVNALGQLGADELARRYQRGIEQWQDPAAMMELDSWISAADEGAHQWLRTLLRTHRSELQVLVRG